MQQTAETLYHQAKSLAQQGKVQDSLVVYDQLLKIRPNEPQFFYEVAELLSFYGDYQQALKFALQAEPYMRNQPVIFNLFGMIFEGLQNFEKSEEAYKEGLKIDPKRPEFYGNLGSLYVKWGRYEEAEKAYKDGLRHNPDFAELYHAYGFMLYNLGKYKEAGQKFLKAITLKPSLHQSRMNYFQSQLRIREVIHWYKFFQQQQTELLPEDYQALVESWKCIAGWVARNREYFEEHLEKLEQLSQAMLAVDLNNMKAVERSSFQKNKDATLGYLHMFRNLNNIGFPTEDVSDCTELPVLGDSHAMPPAWQNVLYQGTTYQMKPYLVVGLKMWHLANPSENREKEYFKQQLCFVPRGPCVLSFGEIDCRVNEGIWDHAQRHGKDVEEVIQKTVKGYLGYLEQFSKNYSFIICGIPAPDMERYRTVYLSSPEKFKKSVLRVNEVLKEECRQRKLEFIDLYHMTLGENLASNKEWHIDGCHLKPTALPSAMENFLS